MKKFLPLTLVILTFLLIAIALVAFNPFQQGIEPLNSEVSTTTEETQGSSVNSLYFYSYTYEDENGAYALACPQTKDIDWELATYALSAYMQFEELDEEHGPAEIQRNFDENCERNMQIYETLGPRISSPDPQTSN
ncbi:MAG: hypothetical protein AAB582_01905 [Patescibacteria group bacterium]